MAKNTRSRKPRYVGYVRYVVDAAIKSQVNASTESQGKLLDKFAKCVDDGYKFSIAYDDDSNTYMVSIYGDSLSSPYPGVGLAARHSDLIKALRLLDIVHHQVYAAGWPEVLEDSPDQYTW